MSMQKAQGFFDLSAKKALIIGGTSGIGLAIARRFTSAGCQVIVSGRTNRIDDNDIEFLACDVTDESSIEELFETLAKRFGAIDCLIVNAGIAPDDGGPFGKMSTDQFDNAMATNTRGPFLCLNRAPEIMNDGGSIIITTSGAANLVFPGYATYGASKSALQILAGHAAAQLGTRGIRVNCLSPGTIVTPIQPEDDPEAIICEAQTCLGRMGTTDDVIGAYHFLAADESRYVTATELIVDGGWVGGMTERSAGAVLANASDRDLHGGDNDE